MDPITAPMLMAVLAKVFDGSLGEAGKQTWAALTALVRRTFSERSKPAVAVAELSRQPADPAKVEALADTLADEADRDPEFAAELGRWLADSQQATGDVTNIISGSAHVHGNVVQARDIHGSITFGDPNAH